METISCIIPVYNAKKYLSRCLDSIIRQTYTNLEVILVDDGSVDGSGQICDYYANQHSFIKVIHIRNSGASRAREKGLSIAEGKYITFLDSDDYVAENYIQNLYSLIKEKNLSISACRIMRRSEGDFLPPVNKECKRYTINYNELMVRFFHYEFWGLYGKLYLKEVFNNVYFPQATISEDYVIMAQLFHMNKELAYSDKPLYFYEIHSDSLSHQGLSSRAFEEFENVLYVYNYIKKNCDVYTEYAFVNLVQTALKLSLLKTEDTKSLFSVQFSEISKFLKKNIFQIIKCNKLGKKLRILSIMLCICPYTTCSFYHFLKKG